MTAVRRHYVDGPHGQMHLRVARPDAATAPPLLCIHMSPMTGRVFERVLGEIGRDRLALAFDTPGYGQSDAPAAPPSIEDYAAALLAGLEAFGVTGPVDLAGYHTGGMTALAMAALAPARVRRLVVIGAAILTDAERQAFSAHYGPKAPDADGGHLLRRWRGFVYHHLRPGVALADVADAFREAMTGGANDWWGHAAAFAFDQAAALARLDQPALILNLGDDLSAYAARAAGLAPRSHLLDLPGWGHGFLDQHSADAAALLRSFLDAPDAAPFDRLHVPASALGDRYPPEDSSFAPN